MDTSIFRYVLEVEKYRNITQAAKRLFISQPALTKQLNKLEKELGFSPFDRTHSPISVTPQGEIFLDFARRYVQLESEMMDSLRQFNQIPAEPVLIATTHRGGAYAAVQAAPFMMTHPEIHLSYLNRNSQQCEEELESESIDLAIYTEPVHSENIEYMPVQEDPLVFVIPQESPILEDLDISDNSLEHPVEIDISRFRNPSLRYILATPGQGLYDAEKSFFRKYHITPIHPQRIDYVDTRYLVACSGCGIALLPHTTIRNSSTGQNPVYGTIKGDTLYRYVIVARKKGRNLSPSAEIVWRYMISASAKNILPENVKAGARGMQQFFVKYMSFPLMITVGIGTNLTDYAKVFTNPAYIVIIMATVIGAMIGTFIVGKLFHFYPVEGMLTAGLCMANGGGAGDVQCLGAAHRMELMSYAQISSRIGGAIMLVIASFIFGKFL